MDMALSRLASNGEPIPAEKVHEDLGIDLDEIDAMDDVELSESTRQMTTAVEDKEYWSMTTDEMQRLINQQMREGKSWPQVLEVLAEVLNIRLLPEVPNAETLKAMAEAQQMLTSGECKTYDSAEELLRDVLGDDWDACYKSYMSFPDGTEVTYSRLRGRRERRRLYRGTRLRWLQVGPLSHTGVNLGHNQGLQHQGDERPR